MDYALYRSEFFSYLSSLLYSASRWCEWQSLKVATRPFTIAEPIFEGPGNDLMAAGVMGTVSLDHTDPEIREALVRGYTAPRQEDAEAVERRCEGIASYHGDCPLEDCNG